MQKKIKNKMSNSRWRKRWLCDCTVEVLRTTRWQRRIAFSDPACEEEIQDVRGEFSSEVYEDLGNNTSPFKKRRLLNDCLADEKNESQTSCNDGLQFTVAGCDLSTANCLQEPEIDDYGVENMEDEAVDCEAKIS